MLGGNCTVTVGVGTVATGLAEGVGVGEGMTGVLVAVGVGEGVAGVLVAVAVKVGMTRVLAVPGVGDSGIGAAVAGCGLRLGTGAAAIWLRVGMALVPEGGAQENRGVAPKVTRSSRSAIGKRLSLMQPILPPFSLWPVMSLVTLSGGWRRFH